MEPDDNSNDSGLPATNQPYSVPQDDDAQADLDLQDDKDEALQDAYSDETASEAVGMPEEDLKEGLDNIAFDEQNQATSPNDDEAGDDWREHVEDMDEGDKER